MNLLISFLLLFQTPSPSPTPHVLERTPALFTLIYVGGFGLIILLLLLGLIRNRRQAVAPIPADLPREVRRRLGSTSTNRGLRALRWYFCCFQSDCFPFTSTGPGTPQNRTISFRSLATKTSVCVVSRNQPCEAGSSIAVVVWTSRLLITNATPAER